MCARQALSTLFLIVKCTVTQQSLRTDALTLFYLHRRLRELPRALPRTVHRGQAGSGAQRTGPGGSAARDRLHSGKAQPSSF